MFAENMFYGEDDRNPIKSKVLPVSSINNYDDEKYDELIRPEKREENWEAGYVPFPVFMANADAQAKKIAERAEVVKAIEAVRADGVRGVREANITPTLLGLPEKELRLDDRYELLASAVTATQFTVTLELNIEGIHALSDKLREREAVVHGPELPTTTEEF